MVAESAPASRPKTFVAYGAMLAATAGLFLLIRGHGQTLTAPDQGAALSRPVGTAPPHLLMHVLLALVVVIVRSRLLGALFRYLHQPAVIGEVIAGILLGPSLLGQIFSGGAGLHPASEHRSSPRHRGAGRRHPIHVPGRARARHPAC